MECNIVQYALEYIIRCPDVDEDVKTAARLSLKDQDFLFYRVKALRKKLDRAVASIDYLIERYGAPDFDNESLLGIDVTYELNAIKEALGESDEGEK